uniref:Digestive cysteine proteinase 2 n=1 Tax=Salmo salar TaxID=8030 RepID=B5XGB8_SALSA|nr:Digestive cysteine proteinase 2 precursor [Salmo salar]ACI69888.1 Digestive cysteine proteinase 2 precursor [Salmo salar]
MMNANAALGLLVGFFALFNSSHAIALLRGQWSEHKLTYGLSFKAEDEHTRKQIFEENLKYIENVNAANLTYKLKMNHLGHLRAHEVVKGMNAEILKTKLMSEANYRIELKSNSNKFYEDLEVDWRKVNAVSPVKDQGNCGSCWSFSTTGAMESQYRLKYGKMKLFSEQQLVDCDRQNIDQGCNGGFPVAAFEYIREFGLLTEEEYPYSAHSNQCRFKPDENGHLNSTKVTGYTVIEMNENALTEAIYKRGPISVAIDASSSDFQFYHSGVYQNPSCGSAVSELDHAVLAVGFGVDKVHKTPYYIVKNSWSSGWGDHGYIKMIRNGKNNCGIATFATYPNLYRLNRRALEDDFAIINYFIYSFFIYFS